MRLARIRRNGTGSAGDLQIRIDVDVDVGGAAQPRLGDHGVDCRTPVQPRRRQPISLSRRRDRASSSSSSTRSRSRATSATRMPPDGVTPAGGRRAARAGWRPTPPSGEWVRSSWATSAVKRRSRSAASPSRPTRRSTSSAMWLNDVARCPNSSVPRREGGRRGHRRRSPRLPPRLGDRPEGASGDEPADGCCREHDEPQTAPLLGQAPPGCARSARSRRTDSTRRRRVRRPGDEHRSTVDCGVSQRRVVRGARRSVLGCRPRQVGGRRELGAPCTTRLSRRCAARRACGNRSNLSSLELVGRDSDGETRLGEARRPSRPPAVLAGHHERHDGDDPALRAATRMNVAVERRGSVRGSAPVSHLRIGTRRRGSSTCSLGPRLCRRASRAAA